MFDQYQLFPSSLMINLCNHGEFPKIRECFKESFYQRTNDFLKVLVIIKKNMFKREAK